MVNEYIFYIKQMEFVLMIYIEPILIIGLLKEISIIIKVIQ